MSPEVWAALKTNPAYTALVGEFKDIPEPQPIQRELTSESVEEVMVGNISPQQSEQEDLWNIGQEILFTVGTPGYAHIVDIITDRVRQLRKESSDSSDPDKDKLSALHFKALGAKELASYTFHSIEDAIGVEKPESLS